MGQVHSSKENKQQHLYYEPVVYNIHSGVSLLGPAAQFSSGGGVGSALYSSPCIRTTFRKCRLRADCGKKKLDDDHLDPLPERPLVPRPRPTTLPLNVFRLEADGTEEPFAVDDSYDPNCGGGESDSGESLLDVDSLASSEVEEDEQDRVLRLDFRCHRGREEDRHSRSGSMKGNFSPGSLMNRRLVMSPTGDRLPPDGTASADGTPADTATTGRQCRLIQLSPSFDDDANDDDLFPQSSSSEEEEEEREQQPRMPDGNVVPLSLGCPSPMRLLARDLSFGSELSDLSVDAAAFDDVGRSTVAAIDRLQQEIDSVKRDCLELETCMEHVDGHGPTPQAYTALTSAALSDISECSDVGVMSPDDSSELLSNVEAPTRAHHFGAARSDVQSSERINADLRRSHDSSFEHSTSSSSFVLNSANASLEWDSMRCLSGSNNSGNSGRNRSKNGENGSGRSAGGTRRDSEGKVKNGREGAAVPPKKSTPLNNHSGSTSDGNGQSQVPFVDSGSDFGTPLTNGSPEPGGNGRRLRSESVVSLEWEEEFGRSVVGVDFSESCAEDAVFAPPTPAPLPRSPPMLVGETLPRTASRKISSDSSSLPAFGQAKFQLSPITGERRSIGTDRGTMWSSIESGYIDEFSCESGGNSKQVTPQSADDSDLTSSAARRRRKLRRLFGANRDSVDNHKSRIALPAGDPIVDSAYYEGTELLEDVRTWPVVGEKQESDVLLLSRDGTSKEFVSACRRLNAHYVRSIHSDSYGAVRAVLVQMLAHGYSPFEHSGGLDQAKRKISLWMRCHHNWLTKWNFARKLNYDEKTCLQGMLDCFDSLDWLTRCVLSSTDKDHSASIMLNSDPELDVQAMEAVKLLMMMSLVDLHESLAVDKAVPVFALLLFAKDVSHSPEAYLSNHLNHVGSSQTLDKLDMFLLGYALGLTICLLRPSAGDNEHSVSYFPDCNLGAWPEIFLIVNDSGHQQKEQYSIVLR